MLFYLFALLISLVKGGQIYSQDMTVFPNNKVTPCQFTFIFTLETTISDSDFLRIVFPFKLNNVQPGYWDIYSCSTNSTANVATFEASTVLNDDNAFFVRFYNSTNPTMTYGLFANTSYFLTFIGSPDSSASVGLNFPIQLYTVSNNIGSWIIYDSNPVFGVFELANAYVSSTSVTMTIDSSETDYNIFGADYNVTIDIKPSINVATRARIDFKTGNSGFRVESCNTLVEDITGFTRVTGTFSSINDNTVRGIISSSLVAGNSYRFYCMIRNPISIDTSGLSILIYRGYVNTVTESGLVISGLSSETDMGSSASGVWDESLTKIFLTWGVEASSSSTPTYYTIYKDHNAYEKWYQSAQIFFAPAQNVISNSPLQVIVSTFNDPALVVLSNTIYNQLPAYSPSTPVSCGTSQGVVTCSNVGPLVTGTQYFISFKFNYQSSGTVSTTSTFGRVQVVTQDSLRKTLVGLSTTTINNKNVITNIALYTSSQTNGIVATSNISSLNISVPYITNTQLMDLRLTVPYFSRNIVPISTGVSTNIGIEFYTTYEFTSSTQPTCSVDGLVDTIDWGVTDCTLETTANMWTRLRFRIRQFWINTAPVSVVFPSGTAYFPGTFQFAGLTVPSTVFTQFTMVTSFVTDFIGRWVNNFATASSNVNLATNSQPFFFNTIVYQYGGLGAVDISTTFFWTGSSAADPTSDGSIFPTMIRIAGSLNATEQANAQRILLFFNDMYPLNYDNPCYATQSVTCSFKDSIILENAGQDNLPDYSTSKKIEIILSDNSQPFNLYIPVRTLQSKATVGFFMTLVREINASCTSYGLYNTRHSKRIRIRTTPNVFVGYYPVKPPSTPRLVIPASTPMGTILNTATVTGVTPVTPGVPGQRGGAYAYCADYDFTTASGFRFQTYPTTAALHQSCVKVFYTVNKNIFCFVCPIESTMGTSITLTRFTLPSNAGVDFNDLVLVFGNMFGDLIANATYDRQANVLTQLNMGTAHSIEFSPSYLKRYSRNIKTSLTINPTSTLPSSIALTLSPLPGQSLNIQPTFGVPCQVRNVTTTSCATAMFGTSVRFFITATWQQWPINTYVIDFLADSTFPSISSLTTITYNLNINVNGISGVVNHHFSSPGTFTMSVDPQDNFNLTNLTYYFSNRASLSMVSFQFSIPNDIFFYRGHKFIFNLGGLASANALQVSNCYVKLMDNITVSTDFYVCNVSDLSRLNLMPKYTVNGSYILVLESVYIPSSTVPRGISVRAISLDGVNTIASNLATRDLAYSATSARTYIAALNINYRRLYADPGSISLIKLALRPGAAAITLDSYMYLYFPYYYAPKLGVRNIYCAANGNLSIECSVVSQRLLRLKNFPFTVNIGDLLEIHIFGVITPVIPIPAGKIFVAIDSDADPYVLTEFQTFTDSPSIGYPPNSFPVSSYVGDSYLIREITTYTMIFTTDAIGVKAGNIFAMDFPDRYGVILNYMNAPIFQLSQLGSSTIYKLQSSGFGARFKFRLPIDLVPETTYKVVVNNVENPEYPTCVMDSPIITISNSSEFNALYKSSPNGWDYPNFNFDTDPNLAFLQYADSNGNPISELSLTIGIYSKPIQIVTQSGSNFVNKLGFNVTRSDIKSFPSTLSANSGAASVSFRIAAVSTKYPSIIIVGFNKSESSTNTAYVDLPKLVLKLTNQVQVLPTPAIKIAAGGTSLPYSWDLLALDLIPHTEIKIDVSINDATTSPLTIIGGSSLTFSSSDSSGAFTFTLSSGANPSNPPSFNLSISGDDSQNYRLQNKTIVVVVLIQDNTPPAIYALNVTSYYSPTSQLFSYNISQMVSIYWHAALVGQLVTQDCVEITSSYQSSIAFDALSSNQAQYGVFYYYDDNQIRSAFMSNLVSYATYAYVLCPTNQLGIVGTAINGSFITADNQARIYEVQILFSSNSSKASLTPLTCLFMNYLQLPNLNVIAMDGTTCSQASYFDDLTTYNYSDVRIYIYGNRRTDTISTLGTTLSDAINELNLQVVSTFTGTFTEALRQGNSLSSYLSTSMSLFTPWADPYLNTSIITYSVLSTQVTIENLELPSGFGYIYAIASIGSVNPPQFYQIRAKQNVTKYLVPGANIRYVGSPVNLTIKGLSSNTTYNIYYYASNEDLGQYATVTDVYIKTVTTPVIKVEASASHLKVALGFIMMVVLLICI